MTTNRKIIQISLISVGIFLILATYFLYPTIKEKKLLKKELSRNEKLKIGSKESNTFENVTYKGFYKSGSPFTVMSEKAFILKKEPDLIYMDKMKVTMFMNDGRIVTITSDKGRYNKLTYDCFFEKNVKATDGETVIKAGNLDLLASIETAAVYNEVTLINPKGLLKADKVDYNFELKNYRISMFENNKKVRLKVVK